MTYILHMTMTHESVDIHTFNFYWVQVNTYPVSDIKRDSTFVCL